MRRRQALTIAGSSIASFGLGSLLLSQEANATATLSTSNLGVENQTKTTQDGTIQDVAITLEGSWGYDIPNQKNPESWQVVLQVSEPEGEPEPIAATTGDAKYLSGSGEFEIVGSLLDGPFTKQGLESQTDGETERTEVVLSSWFQVFNSTETMIAKATVSDSATIRVENAEYNISEHGSLNAEAEIQVIGT